jgi:hypothetical protein
VVNANIIYNYSQEDPNHKMKLLDFIRAFIDDWVGDLDLQLQQERVNLQRNNVQDGNDEDDDEKEP